MWGLVSKLLKREISWHPWIRGTLKQSWVYSGVAHILFRVYSGVEYRHVYSTQLSRIYECILNTLYWVYTHTLYSAELSRTECLSMSIPTYSLQDWLKETWPPPETWFSSPDFYKDPKTGTLHFEKYLYETLSTAGATAWMLHGLMDYLG